MIKFLADMGVSTKNVLWLRNNGYEAVHLLEQGLYKLSDANVLEKARMEKPRVAYDGSSVLLWILGLLT